MSKLFKYKFLDLPAIPKEILNNISPGELIREFPGRTCTKNNNTFAFKTSTGRYYHANPELAEWVKNNVPGEIDFVGIRYQYGSLETPSHGAHTDATRDYGILYVADNADGVLNFWQMENEPTEIDHWLLVNDYDSLSLLESVPTPNGTWYLVNGKVIHSVEHMTRTRTTIQINLKSLEGLI